MTEENTSPMAEGLRVVHPRLGTQPIPLSQEPQGKQPNGTGIQKGKHDLQDEPPTHSQDPNL